MGSRKLSVLPEPVPVVTTRFSPLEARVSARSWWLYRGRSSFSSRSFSGTGSKVRNRALVLPSAISWDRAAPVS